MTKTLTFTRYDYPNGQSDLVAYLRTDSQPHRVGLLEGRTSVVTLFEQDRKSALIDMLCAVGPIEIEHTTQVHTLNRAEKETAQ